MTMTIMADEQQRIPTAGQSEIEEYYSSIDIRDNNSLMAMERPRSSPERTAKNLWEWARSAVKKAKLSRSSRPPPTSDHHTSDRSIFELTEMAACALASGLEVPNNNINSVPQGGNDNGVAHGIDLESAIVPGDGSPNMPPPMFPPNLAISLWIMSLLTLVMVIATALYKSARGVVFGRNKGAYYLTLIAIFASGVAEAFTAYWVSRSRDVNKRRFSFGRVILFASTGPFVAIVAIGGFAFIEG